MNHYPHHIGDFDKATRHLTRVERSIYRDLIELYYDTEEQLTLDRVALCRRVLARTDEESTAVEQVLNEFFSETPFGWYHARCDFEIERYRNHQTDKARAGKASAAAKALKAQQAINGSSTVVEQTLSGATTGHQQNPTNHKPVTSNQEPVTKNQEPRTEEHNRSLNLQKANAKDMSGKPDVAEQIISDFNEITGRNFRCTKSTRSLIAARLADGFAPDDLVRVIRKKSSEWRDDPKMCQYIRPETLFNASKFVSYVGQLGVESLPERQRRLEAEFLGDQKAENIGVTINA